MNFFNALKAGGATTEQALAIFDALDPVDQEFMLGSWEGSGFPTGHPLDGLLESYHWRGKVFETPERVHPLVFSSRGGKLTTINPLLVFPGAGFAKRFPILKSELVGRVFQACIPLLTTKRPQARLRMMEYRGKVSATMVYDALPIHDVFRKVDGNTVMGLMDMRGLKRPFFFVLRRA